MFSLSWERPTKKLKSSPVAWSPPRLVPFCRFCGGAWRSSSGPRCVILHRGLDSPRAAAPAAEDDASPGCGRD
eukprot:9317328-Pyramimonas_sp.AAC.1